MEKDFDSIGDGKVAATADHPSKERFGISFGE